MFDGKVIGQLAVATNNAVFSIMVPFCHDMELNPDISEFVAILTLINQLQLITYNSRLIRDMSMLRIMLILNINYMYVLRF